MRIRQPKSRKGEACCWADEANRRGILGREGNHRIRPKKKGSKFCPYHHRRRRPIAMKDKFEKIKSEDDDMHYKSSMQAAGESQRDDKPYANSDS